ncbi:MAG TPA: class I SAM-dependent methyltransferase [Candidatus Moranbacteria bacterium]|nr:class I SAM-dependent methyltransferase [Candidatus Moranbacteria bacterium]
MKYFDTKNSRLVFLESKSSAGFWDNHWKTEKLKADIERGKDDQFVSRITKKFLPLGSKILEGGCGKGAFVYSLKISGYDAYGIDYAKETIKEINEVMPDLNISLGNVEGLDFSDNFFDGYWSLGVIEHFFDGYDKITKEMTRVIKPGGYLFITFPYISPLRRIKAKLGKYPKFQEKELAMENFYQFALSHKKTSGDFEKLGFSIVYKKPFDGIKGLKDEISQVKPILQRIYDSKNIFIMIFQGLLSRALSPFTSHSILLVFKKND